MMKPQIYVPRYGRIKKLGCLVGIAGERFLLSVRGAIVQDAIGMRGAPDQTTKRILSWSTILVVESS